MQLAMKLAGLLVGVTDHMEMHELLKQQGILSMGHRLQVLQFMREAGLLRE